MIIVSSPIKHLGAWLTRSNNTVYQAATDGFALGFDSIGVGDSIIDGFTDSNNPPVTKRSREKNVGSGGISSDAYICMPVRKNDYWKLVAATSATIFWIPWEP